MSELVLRVSERWAGGLLPADVELVRGDAIDLLAAFRTAGRTFPLVYIDPPFALGRSLATMLRFDTGERSGELERWRWSDAWGGLDAYLAFMEHVLLGIRDVLSPSGSLLLHCDHHASPYLAVLCDRIFGMGDRGGVAGAPGFRNELVWAYGLGGSSGRCYPKKHDTIFWYTRGADWTFAPPRVPATSARMRGQTKKAPDVLEVPALNNMAHERTGYPTQKPLALLEQLVLAHSAPDDTVLDLFGGSGTTALAAARNGRRGVSVDASPQAIGLQRARLLDAGVALRVVVCEGAVAVAAPDVSVQVTDGVLRVCATAGSPPLELVAAGRVVDGAFVARVHWWGGRRSPDGVFRDARDEVALSWDAADDALLIADLAGTEQIVPLAR